jgi:hypothetical protein
MKKRFARYAAGVALLAAAGFAAASILTGGALSLGLTVSSTASTATVKTTVSTATTTASRRVTVCHPTGSKTHPFVTVTVDQHAVAAVIKGGGHVGACTGSEKPRTTHGTTTASPSVSKDTGSSNAKTDNGHAHTASGSSTTTVTTTETAGPGNGVGQGHGHGK